MGPVPQSMDSHPRSGLSVRFHGKARKEHPHCNLYPASVFSPFACLPVLFFEDAEKPVQGCFLKSGRDLQLSRVQPDALAFGTFVYLNSLVIDLDELHPALGAHHKVKIPKFFLLFLPELLVLLFLCFLLPLELHPGKILFFLITRFLAHIRPLSIPKVHSSLLSRIYFLPLPVKPILGPGG